MALLDAQFECSGLPFHDELGDDNGVVRGIAWTALQETGHPQPLDQRQQQGDGDISASARDCGCGNPSS
jgi:hypothetical protein